VHDGIHHAPELDEEQLRAAREDAEKAYMRGRIDGLEFAIRCNGVSGNEVSKA
jgi:hypothetical protein